MYGSGYRSGFGATPWVIGGLVLALIVAVITFPLWTASEATITVDRLERVCDGGTDGGCKYLIYGEDETFQNTDTIILGKFNSSDIYAEFDEGATYDCKVFGWRIPLFSMYRDINECELVEPAPLGTTEVTE